MTAAIDTVMPVFDATRVERVPCAAPAQRAYAVLRGHDMLSLHTPLMDAAMAVRGLPDRLRGVEPAQVTSGMTVGALFDAPRDESLADAVGPWLGLAERPGEELVFGVVGRFWTPSIEWRRVDVEAFSDFDEPGWGSIAASLGVADVAAGTCVLTYEARTRCHDERSRRSFLRYWRLVSPFVGHIQRAFLLAAREHVTTS